MQTEAEKYDAIRMALREDKAEGLAEISALSEEEILKL
jgi:hypothetical protein